MNYWNADLVVKTKGRRESAKCSRWWFPPLENYTQPASVYGRWLMKSSLFGNMDNSLAHPWKVWHFWKLKLVLVYNIGLTNGKSKGLEIATSNGWKDDLNEDDGDENDEEGVDDDQGWCLKQGGIRWRGRPGAAHAARTRNSLPSLQLIHCHRKNPEEEARPTASDAATHLSFCICFCISVFPCHITY